MKATLSTVMLCAIAALTAGCDVDADGILSSDPVPTVDLTDGNAVCVDDKINSIAASEIEWWLHSSPEAALDQRITAALTVSIENGRPTSHSGTTTTCESHGVGIAFVRPDGSVSGSARSTAHFTVTASPGGPPHIVVDRASLLLAAQDLIGLQEAERSSEKLTAVR